MKVTKPLIAKKDQTTQLLRASASVDWNTQIAVLQFYSVSSEGKKVADHAICNVKYGNGSDWKAEWQRSAYMIKPCLTRLEQDVIEGQNHMMKRGMAYRVFSSMVEYSKSYKGFEDVILDSAALEGTARIKFQTTDDDGDFVFSPYWVDSLGQLSGFVMNGNDAVDQKTTAYLNHGWDSMRCANLRAFSISRNYRTYVKMQPYDKTTRIGDVYVFEEDTIVAVYAGVKVSDLLKVC